MMPPSAISKLDYAAQQYHGTIETPSLRTINAPTSAHAHCIDLTHGIRGFNGWVGSDVRINENKTMN